MKKFYIYGEFIYSDYSLKAYDDESGLSNVVTKLIENPNSDGGEFVATYKEAAIIDAYISLVNHYRESTYMVDFLMQENNEAINIYTAEMNVPALTIKIDSIDEEEI